MRIETFPDRASWLAARRLGIGGSDVPAILGISPWKTPLQVWAEKLCLADEDESSYTLRRGSHMEPLLWQELAAEVPDLVAYPQTRAIVTGHEPWLRYSPDAFLLIGPPGESDRALGEGKSHPRGASEWDEGAPAHVVAQVQYGMHVCDLPACYVAVDLGTEFKWTRIERDPAWWPTHKATLREFWRRVVEEDAPEPTGDEGDKHVLGRMFPEPSSETKALDGAFLEDAQTLAEIDETIKACEAQRDVIQNKVRAALGDAGRGILPDGTGWTWSKQSRPKMVADPSQPPSEFRVLRRFGVKKEKR